MRLWILGNVLYSGWRGVRIWILLLILDIALDTR